MNDDRFKGKRMFVILTSSYLVAGMLLLIIMAESKHMPVHVGFIGLLSVIASYGVFRMRRWALYLATLSSLFSLAFSSITLSAMIMLFSHDPIDILALIGIAVYMFLSMALLVYLVTQRESFS
jgi:uncharacterized membrane protein (DUF2068 family)